MILEVLILTGQIEEGSYMPFDENSNLTMNEMIELRDSQIKRVSLNIRDSEILGYIVQSSNDDTDFNIQLFTTVGNFTMDYSTGMINKLNKIINE